MKRYLILLLALGLALGLGAQQAGFRKLSQRDPAVPLSPVLQFPAEGDSVMNGQALKWALAPDSEWAGFFDIYIDGTLVSENLMGESYLLSGMEFGTHTWYVLARNPSGESPPSESRSFVIIPGVGIGNEATDQCLPICTFQDYSYSQSIFLQSEIALGNQDAPCCIESIAYYWNGVGDGANSNNWVIYMGHKEAATFADGSDWLPLSQMIEVFAGQVQLTDTAGWVEIELDNPFVYNNVDNLVVAVYENSPGFDDGNQYFYNTPIYSQIRSIRHSGYAPDLDPGSPPSGSLAAAIPNIRIRFGDLPTAPILALMPANIDFGIVRNGEASEAKVVRVTNMGIGTIDLSAANISIIGTHAAEFSFDPACLPAALGPMQSVQIPVCVTGISTGEISATLRIVYNGQNHDVALAAEVLPPGVIIIGDAAVPQRQPFGIQYGYERSAALYTADQISSSGFLDMLAWDCAATSDVALAYKIWVKNTTETSLGNLSWQQLTADMSLVKVDVYTPNAPGWQQFPLFSPFAYMGGSLVIAVETYYGGDGLPSNHGFNSSHMGQRSHLIWYQNGSPPTGNGELSYFTPNIKMHFSSNVEHDIAALNLTGEPMPNVGEVSNYTLRIKNNGNSYQNNYQIKLLDSSNSTLAVVNGPPIESLQILDVIIPWTPETSGSRTIFGQVELAGDELLYNDRSDTLRVYVHPAATQVVDIGAGDQSDNVPMIFSRKNSLYQCIYLAEELGFESGTISSMALYNRFSEDLGHQATKIYLGSTNLDNLNSGFIPASELTLVFNGNIAYPRGQNTIFIPFQRPYLHRPGNLVVMFHRPMDTQSYTRPNYFKCQDSSGNRARRNADDNATINPFNPWGGSVYNKLPQATFYHTVNEVANDLAALKISGPDSTTLGNALSFVIRIKNYGSQAQSDYTVKLLRQDGAVMASVPGPTINSLQTVRVIIPWTPPTAGNYVLCGKVELNGDQFEVNNRTALHRLCVHGAGATALTVGDGSQRERLPMDMSYRHSLYQTLYFSDDMQGLVGQISGLQFYNYFHGAIDGVSVSIWMGTTTQSGLSDGWIPASQLTQVFEGEVDFPSGDGIVNIHFDQPFMCLDGSNLVLMVQKSTAVAYPGWAHFKCQDRGGDGGRFFTTAYTPVDPNAPPPSAPITAILPKTTFMTIPGALGQVFGCVTNVDNEPLCEAVVSINNGLFTTTTNAAGEYLLPQVLILPDAYSISFNAHGYYEQIQAFELQEGEQLNIDVALQPLPQVSLSGTIIANDSGVGIPDGHIEVCGYQAYQAGTDAAGNFTIPGVYANRSYDFTVSAAGYNSIRGTVNIGSINHDLGELMLYEITSAPRDMSAMPDGNVVELSWLPPEPEAKRPDCDRDDKAPKVFIGYKVYRLLPSQEEYESLWATLTPAVITALSFSDSSWVYLPNNQYLWAVKAIYTGEVASEPSFSNILVKDVQTGLLVGTVKSRNNTAIAGATISNGTFSTTSNYAGAYALILPVGMHTVTAAAVGYLSQSVENVSINQDEHSFLSFVLRQETANDDALLPVAATTLWGNYPNPFNPETTISYSVLQPGRVRLEVYNIKGQRVRTLVDSDHAAGHYKKLFNARDDGGCNLPSGVYLLRMSAPGYQKTGKMILMK